MTGEEEANKQVVEKLTMSGLCSVECGGTGDEKAAAALASCEKVTYAAINRARKHKC